MSPIAGLEKLTTFMNEGETSPNNHSMVLYPPPKTGVYKTLNSATKHHIGAKYPRNVSPWAQSYPTVKATETISKPLAPVRLYSYLTRKQHPVQHHFQFKSTHPHTS